MNPAGIVDATVMGSPPIEAPPCASAAARRQKKSGPSTPDAIPTANHTTVIIHDQRKHARQTNEHNRTQETSAPLPANGAMRQSHREGKNAMLANLFSSYELKGKTLRNRTVVAPMVMNLCNSDGTCTERFIAYHEAKAQGGFGMIITEDFAVMPHAKGFVGVPGLWTDSQIEGFKEFTDRIHRLGAVVVA